MRVAIFGNFGVRNLGDDLILLALKKEFQHDQVIVFCGNPKEVEQSFHIPAYSFFPGGIRSFLRRVFQAEDFKKSLEALESVDEVVFAGGGIFVDRHIKAVLLWFFQLKKIIQCKKPFRLLGHSFELRRWWTKKLFSSMLKKASDISVRDRASLKLLSSMGIMARLTPDLSWKIDLLSLRGPRTLLRVTKQSRSIQDNTHGIASSPLSGVPRNDKKTICLALCRWGLSSSQKKILRSFLEQKKQEGYKIIGFAFQTLHDDDRKVYESLGLDIPILTDLPTILSMLSKSSLLIGMRLHALILALRLKKPVIALNYQDKVQNLIQDERKEDFLLSLQEMDEESLQAVFRKAVEASRG